MHDAVAEADPELEAGACADGWREVSTLAMQRVLIGPSPPRRGVIGRQGPGVYTEDLFPLPDESARAIDAEPGPHSAIDPNLRRASALAPEIRGVGGSARPQPGPRLDLAGDPRLLRLAGCLLVRERPGALPPWRAFRRRTVRAEEPGPEAGDRPASPAHAPHDCADGAASSEASRRGATLRAAPRPVRPRRGRVTSQRHDAKRRPDPRGAA